MKIGILFFSDTYFVGDQNQSVMGRFVANDSFLKGLHDAGHSVFIYVSTSTEAQYLSEKFAKRFENFKIVSLHELYLAPKLYEPDVLHILSPNLYKCFYLRDHVFKKMIPVTGVTHSLGHQPYLEWVLLNLINNPMPCDALICTSPTARSVVENFQERMIQKLQAAAKLKTKVIPLGILPVLPINTPRQEVRARHGLSDDAFCFLWIGRFSYSSKADLAPLFLAFREFLKNQKYKNARLICAGSSERSEEINLLNTLLTDWQLNDFIILKPDITDCDKNELLALSDCFVAPSDNIQETFGLSLLEALDSGLPVIANDWDGFRSIVDETCGLLIPTCHIEGKHPLDSSLGLHLNSVYHLLLAQSVAFNHENLVNALQTMMDDPALRTKLAEGAKKRAASFYWDKIILKYGELWQQLIERALSQTFVEVESTINFRADFSPYWTNEISSQTNLVVTGSGEELLKGVIPVRFYAEMEEWIEANIIKELLLKSLVPLSMAALKKDLLADDGIIHLHLMWLIKYGFMKTVT
ncbi:MAG: glycosyl transferase, group 1 family [uncultured bacterium]|nr:MAG: glycosyl transferase, group 1 family [uncultured bacterium]